MKWAAIIGTRGAEGEKVLTGMSVIDVYKVCGGLTSAVFGTDSQNISILMLPRVVWSVTDMAVGRQPHD